MANDIDNPDRLKDVKQDKFDVIVRQVRIDRYSQLKDQKARNRADKLLVKFEQITHYFMCKFPSNCIKMCKNVKY